MTPPGAAVPGAAQPAPPSPGAAAAVPREDPDVAPEFRMTRHSLSDELAGLSVAGGGLVMLAGCVVALRRGGRRPTPFAAPAYAGRWPRGDRMPVS